MSLIPSVPDARLIDEAGYVTSEWRVYFEELTNFLRDQLYPLLPIKNIENRFFFQTWLTQDGQEWFQQSGYQWLQQ